jgi:hypothetical protein
LRKTLASAAILVTVTLVVATLVILRIHVVSFPLQTDKSGWAAAVAQAVTGVEEAADAAQAEEKKAKEKGI